MLRLSTAGITLALCVFIGLGFGLLLKKYLHGGDAAVIGGILLGVVSGFYQMIRDIRAINRGTKGGDTP